MICLQLSLGFISITLPLVFSLLRFIDGLVMLPTYCVSSTDALLMVVFLEYFSILFSPVL